MVSNMFNLRDQEKSLWMWTATGENPDPEHPKMGLEQWDQGYPAGLYQNQQNEKNPETIYHALPRFLPGRPFWRHGGGTFQNADRWATSNTGRNHGESFYSNSIWKPSNSQLSRRTHIVKAESDIVPDYDTPLATSAIPQHVWQFYTGRKMSPLDTHNNFYSYRGVARNDNGSVSSLWQQHSFHSNRAESNSLLGNKPKVSKPRNHSVIWEDDTFSDTGFGSKRYQKWLSKRKNFFAQGIRKFMTKQCQQNQVNTQGHIHTLIQFCVSVPYIAKKALMYMYGCLLMYVVLMIDPVHHFKLSRVIVLENTKVFFFLLLHQSGEYC